MIKGQRATTGGYNPTDCNKGWEKERINGTHRTARTRGLSQGLTIKTYTDNWVCILIHTEQSKTGRCMYMLKLKQQTLNTTFLMIYRL